MELLEFFGFSWRALRDEVAAKIRGFAQLSTLFGADGSGRATGIFRGDGLFEAPCRRFSGNGTAKPANNTELNGSPHIYPSK